MCGYLGGCSSVPWSQIQIQNQVNSQIHTNKASLFCPGNLVKSQKQIILQQMTSWVLLIEKRPFTLSDYPDCWIQSPEGNYLFMNERLFVNEWNTIYELLFVFHFPTIQLWDFCTVQDNLVNLLLSLSTNESSYGFGSVIITHSPHLCPYILDYHVPSSFLFLDLF